MEFQETLLAAQRNQQQKSSAGNFYKARFDPPKKEHKSRDKLSANIQKFLAKKEEEERQKKLEVVKKRDELMAMRDPKAIRKIQKSLKVFKSANKSVLVDAIDHEHTAVTREGPEQGDQDDYGYESQEAAAIYQKMMEKYSKVPDEPKYPTSGSKVKKDLNGIRERVKHNLQHEDDPVPHKRKRKSEHEDKEPSPPPKTEDKKRDEKPKIRKPMPPPMDFNSLLKLAEQKKSDPLEVIAKKVEKVEGEPERLMTKKQRKEYEEEMARRMRRQERLAAAAAGGDKKVAKPESSDRVRSVSKERKPETVGFGRIPKIGEKTSTATKTDKNDSPRSSLSSSHKDKIQIEMEKIEKLQKEKAKLDKERVERDKERLDLERLEKLKAERERIERDIERLNKDKDRLEKTKIKLETSTKEKSLENKTKQSIDLKSQNTYRIDKNANDRKSISSKSDFKQINGHSSHSKPMGQIPNKNGIKDKGPQRNESQKPNGIKSDPNGKLPLKSKDSKAIVGKPGDKPKSSNSFDFDKHISSFKNRTEGESRQQPPGQLKRKLNPEDKKKLMQKRRVVDSESEYDSEMDDFIDDRDEDLDYSKHIKEIFGYDKARYRDMDDDDDPTMESSFSRQMREEYISKRIGIMEDLEDIKMEKKMKKKNKRRISDD